jgi:hypothetical protein
VRGSRARWFAAVIACIALVQGFVPPADARGDGVLLSSRAASMVSADSLEAMLRFLSIDPASGRLRSRFTFRESDLGEVADSLAARLVRYTGQSAVRTSFAVSDELYAPYPCSTENISVRLPGTGPDSAVVIVCAHYDAIGVRTDGWRESWQTLPAPGADDNGTGVAALMEAARVLSGYTLPFDLLFLLFSGEELGKLGSIDFVGRCDSVCAERIRAVINIDMIGYHEGVEAAGSILSDYSSGWIADMLGTAGANIDPSLSMRIIKPGPSNWDHDSFWKHQWNGLPQHIAAVTLAEPLYLGGFIIYPYYHTVMDTLGWVDIGQVERITRLLVGFIAGFSDMPAAAAILPSDILLKGPDSFFGDDLFSVGEEITALVRCRNTGGSDPPDGARIVLTVTLENAAGRSVLRSEEIAPPGPLSAAAVEVGFRASDRYAGENTLRARITVEGFPDDAGDNESAARFVIQGGTQILAGHTFRPNPIRGPIRDAFFCINLTGEANVSIELYTVEGEKIASALVGAGYGAPLELGYSCIPCGELFPDLPHLASGIYVYRLTLRDTGGGVWRYRGRFAVLN